MGKIYFFNNRCFIPFLIFKKVFFVLVFFIFFKFSAQTCSATFIPDMALPTSNASIENTINTLYNNYQTEVLGASAPTTTNINSAIASYDNLNIVVNGSTITGNAITSYSTVSFIGTFASYMRFNPTDGIMKTRIKNLIWWVAQNICTGSLVTDYSGYGFRVFGRPAVLCADYVVDDEFTRNKFLYIYEKNSSAFNMFWNSSYDDVAQRQPNIYVDSDFIYNNIDVMMALVKWFPTSDERYRFMLTYQRYLNRIILTDTVGTDDNFKPDGTGFHHDSSYEAYMYMYNSLIGAMKRIDNTIFQVSQASYLKFRTAILHKEFVTNDNNIVPLPLTGRTGAWDNGTLSGNSLRDLAIVGGHILGLNTADPILAGIHNRKYGGSSALFNYTAVAPFQSGFYQFNHHNAGVFRKNNYIVLSKGFNNQFWGAEIYSNANRYGRYQSYGAMTIIYPGIVSANGFSSTSWDWNYNPGTTTKVLPWDKLIAGWNRIDEYQNKKFAGALAFQKKDLGMINDLTGDFGMFAMDFQERTNLGFSGITATDTHDVSFVFKKSNFYFGDIIVSLGSGISNSDATYPTVTTLYQNNSNPGDVTVNNSLSSASGITTYVGNANNWVIDNLGTGYYVFAGSGDLKIKKDYQQSPAATQTDSTILNTSVLAGIGYINHGTNPLNKEYEYVVVPGTNASEMSALATVLQNSSTKPYEVLNKNANSHIVKHKSTGIYAMALFTSNTAISGNTKIISNDKPCMLMYQLNGNTTQMKLSLANPDLGLSVARSNESYPTQVIRIKLDGEWSLINPNSSVTIVSSDSSSTTLDFYTYQGLRIEIDLQKTGTLANNETQKKSEIKIYPNPVKDILNISGVNNSSWEIHDYTGRELKSGNFQSLKSSSINVSNLKKGNYILKFKNQSITFIKE